MTPEFERDTAVRELVHALVDSSPPAPPFPEHDARPRSTRGPRAAVAAFVVLVLVAGAVAFVARHSSHETRPTTTTFTTSVPAPERSRGRIAYVGRGGLVVVDAPGHERVLVKGSVSSLTWSYDGKWLAFERPGPVNHELTGRELWVVTPSGGAAHRLISNLLQWSWSRSNPSALAALVSQRLGGSRAYVLFANTSWRWEVPVTDYVTGVAWANHTATLAITHGYNPGVVSVVDLFNPAGRCLAPCPGPVKTIDFSPYPPGAGLGSQSFDFSLLIDRYTSDDRAVLAWLDPLGSNSIAMDGLGLLAIPVRGGTATHYPQTLVKPAWVRDAPTGTDVLGDVLVVASSGRMVTDQRQIRRCDSAGQCLAPLVAGGQTMDPAWSPDGTRIAYVRTDASHTYPRLAGSPQIPDWPSRYATRHLWVADAFGRHAREVRGAGNGVAVLEWSDATHVLVVVDDELRSVDVNTGASTVLTGAIGDAGPWLPADQPYEPTSSWESLVALAP